LVFGWRRGKFLLENNERNIEALVFIGRRGSFVKGPR